ncbi:hypothetical protein GWI33_000206 [Rhynchophorus ferrugineus]|uniref:Uncharacterized protein n=1 Tax=Rhynchophorus ferrugineus TaxID=354439 RepID=A0A834IWU6_RHYFE|nr:hypothetical protein GWI33_000206 [Rhynchophorus ferrugineus]
MNQVRIYRQSEPTYTRYDMIDVVKLKVTLTQNGSRFILAPTTSISITIDTQLFTVYEFSDGVMHTCKAQTDYLSFLTPISSRFKDKLSLWIRDSVNVTFEECRIINERAKSLVSLQFTVKVLCIE